MKRLGSKNKSLGSKSQINLSRSKSEIETSAKELSELEKEMFAIKINDLETRLKRKQELCRYMEEEKQFLESEYESKKVLKKESMQVLHRAYQEFHLEYLLLEGELRGMEDITSKARSLKKVENIHAIKRTEKLSRVEEKLKRKLREVEENIKDIPNLSKEYQELQLEMVKKDENFKAEFSNLNEDFALFMKNLQDELLRIVARVIGDKGLKLHLLPVPYQALFESGMLGCTWFRSVLDICEGLLRQNKEMVRSMEEVGAAKETVGRSCQGAFHTIVLTSQAKELFIALNNDNIKEGNRRNFLDDLKELEADMKHLVKLNEKNFHLQNCIAELLSRSMKLEEDIKEQENIESGQNERSRLSEIIMEAKDIIIQEL